MRSDDNPDRGTDLIARGALTVCAILLGFLFFQTQHSDGVAALFGMCLFFLWIGAITK